MATGYHAILYLTTTGMIVNEIPMTDVPNWLQQINNDGSWSINTEVGARDDDGNPTSSLLPKDQLYSILTDSWRYSVAIVWGTARSGYICQAGPLISWQQTQEKPPIVQLGGSGLWALLRATLQAKSSWPGTSITDGSGDATYTGTLQSIAEQIIANTNTRNPLPIDLLTHPGGTDSRAYAIADFKSAGQNLQELTQDEGGPDVLLKPYFADTSHIRHQALVGNPTLSQTGNPIVFDYGRTATSILPSGDGSAQSSTSYAVGDGSGDTKLWAKAVDPTLPNAGWPILEGVDTSSSVDEQDALQAKVNADQTLNGRQSEIWTVTVRMDTEANPFGTYDAGTFASYVVKSHSLLPDETRSARVLGMQDASNAVEIKHVLEAGT